MYVPRHRLTAEWRKSSYSNAAGGDCVEVAPTDTHYTSIRDSMRPEGNVLIFPHSSWATFVNDLRSV